MYPLPYRHANSVRMKMHRDDLQAWLREVLAKHDETPTGLARRAGLAQSTLTRFLNDPAAPMLSLRSVLKIAQIVGETPLGVPQTATIQPREEAERFTPSAPEVEAAIAALTAEKQDKQSISVWELQTRALELAGYLPGDLLIVDASAAPAEGDVVCATHRHGPTRTDIIWRLYEPPFLVAASTRPAYRRPLIVGVDDVSLSGVVVATLRLRDGR